MEEMSCEHPVPRLQLPCEMAGFMKNAFIKDSFQIYKSSNMRCLVEECNQSARTEDDNYKEMEMSELELMMTATRVEEVQLPAKSPVNLTRTTKNDESFFGGYTDSEGEEYGYYDDCEDTGTMSPYSSNMDDSEVSTRYQDYNPSLGTSSSLGSFGMMESATPRAELNSSFPSAASSSSNMRLNGIASDSSKSVICSIEDHKAPLTCRSFDHINTKASLSVCIALAGFRIIHNGVSEEAEYKVKLIIDGREYITWKRYQDFQSLGHACTELSTWPTRTGVKYALQQTVDAWKLVERNRPWFVKPNNVQYLLSESALLENFMKQLLFEIPCVQTLLEFVLG